MEFDFKSTGERAGLALIATAGLFSAISTFSFLAYCAFCVIQTRVRDRSSPLTSGINNFITTALGKYLISLIISDLCQGIAFVTNYRWAVSGIVDESAACVFQGAISQIGDLGAALWSNIIAFQTFWLLFVQKKTPDAASNYVIAVVWTVLLLLPILGPVAIQHSERNGPFWGYSGAWCWIGNGYQISRLFYLYVWIFWNLFSCFCIYLLIYLKFMGLADYNPSKLFGISWSFDRSSDRRQSPKKGRWKLSQILSHEAVTSDGQSDDQIPVSRYLVRVARRLTLYPIVYAIVVIPVSICRMGVLAGWTPPFWLFAFAGTCFSSSGLANTILFLFTRHSFIQRSLRNPTLNIVTTQHVEVTVDRFPHIASPIPLQMFKSNTVLSAPQPFEEKTHGPSTNYKSSFYLTPQDSNIDLKARTPITQNVELTSEQMADDSATPDGLQTPEIVFSPSSPRDRLLRGP